MDNLLKIKKFSHTLYYLLSVLLVVIPLYYLFYWVFVNHLNETLFNVNIQPTPLSEYTLPVKLQIAGFLASLFPLCASVYIIASIRKLFSFYTKGVIFSFEHVQLFKKAAKALVLYVIFSIGYEAARSVIFSFGNPPGSRVLTVGFSSAEVTTLVIGAIVFIIAWVMDEGRRLKEEHELTI